MEEISFRGYPFRQLNKYFGLRKTQWTVAIAFALYHIGGGQSVSGSFLGPGVYAFVFGLAVAWSNGIALPFGIHFALNVWQPLTGMRGNADAVWILTEENLSPNVSLVARETMGLVMQIIVLVVALALTEYLINKDSTARKNA